MGSLRVPTQAGRGLFKPLSVKDFYEKRNRVLILRQTGGLGDILMHRMMFEDFKLLIPEAKIVFALPTYYHPAVSDHPFIDEIIDSNGVDLRDYMISYTTTTACGRHEGAIAPLADKHRSDIWAEHCGVNLTKHNMHIRLTEEETAYGKEVLSKCISSSQRGQPLFLLAPISAMHSKNMSAEQMNGVARKLREVGIAVVAFHNTPIPELTEAPLVMTNNIRHFMGIVAAADAVISVDTGTFHCAGGLGKPLVGVFTWADGLAYGKWFDFVLIQKHRHFTSGWNCGPCYKWHDCRKCPSTEVRKPCITELTADDIMAGVSMMFNRWPQLRPQGLTFSPAPSDAVALVRAADSSADRLAKVELPVLQAIS